MRYVGERPADPLTILLFPSEGDGEFHLYEDTGDGFEYQRGSYARTSIACSASSRTVTVRLGAPEGDFVPERTRLELDVRGCAMVAGVRIDGRAARRWRQEDDRLIISLSGAVRGRTIEIQRS